MHKPDFRRNLFLSAAALMAVAAPIVFGQLNATQSQAVSQSENKALIAPVYEVASIKPNKTGSVMPSRTDPFDFSRFTVRNVPLYGVIMAAFGVTIESHISGIPNWAQSEKYDIEAKTDSTLAAEIQKLGTRDERRLVRQRMILALLEDRCQLKFHRETKEQSVYWLVVAKPGKLHEAEGDCSLPNHLPSPIGEPGKAPTMACGDWSGSSENHSIGRSVSMALIVSNLSGLSGRTVLDKTGLTGKYDIDFKWTPDVSQIPAPPENSPNVPPSPSQFDDINASFLAAFLQHLGLKLESGKGPVEVIVIDHVERPSAN